VAPATFKFVMLKAKRIQLKGLARFLRFGGKVRIKAEPK
jgi:hypothetical protein